jgi:hypothetical protein
MKDDIPGVPHMIRFGNCLFEFIDFSFCVVNDDERDFDIFNQL